MKTLRLFEGGRQAIPTGTAWLLSDLAEFRGKQALYSAQSPQTLKRLLEHALIESAVSSNRIEGVEVEPGRVRDLILGKPLLRDRDEEEVRGYRDALQRIHADPLSMEIGESTVLELHRLSRGEIWDAGKYKEKDGDIIERYPDGGERVRFRTVPAAETPAAMTALIREWAACVENRWMPPEIALAAFNLDFLCIHPFRDGNGRVSRLLLLLGCYHAGIEVGRYISLERLIEQNKDRYYETLEISSQGWHEGRHDPWPYINYLLTTLKNAYRELVDRVGDLKAPKGAKTEQVRAAIQRFANDFTLAELERSCPGVSRDMIRVVLREQKKLGSLVAEGYGPAAKWKKR